MLHGLSQLSAPWLVVLSCPCPMWGPQLSRSVTAEAPALGDGHAGLPWMPRAHFWDVWSSALGHMSSASFCRWDSSRPMPCKAPAAVSVSFLVCVDLTLVFECG